MSESRPAPPSIVGWIEGIGLRGPGLAGWSASIDALAGRRRYASEPTVLVAPSSLPPAERRRVGRGVKVALEVAFEAAMRAGRDPSTLASVFASSSGDGDNCDAICRELTDERLISPTRFHNSVHNAPSGYWGIASGSMAPSTSLCAYDDSFVAGLDEALTQLASGAGAETDAVLLVAYDAPYPEPLWTARPTPDSFAVALLIARDAGPRSLAAIEWQASGAGVATTLDDPALEALRVAIPAARALPLLVAIASSSSTSLARELVFERASGPRIGLRLRSVHSRHRLDPSTAACA